MCNNWIKAYQSYDWTVNLCNFKESTRYPGFFCHTINPTDIVSFENKFRLNVDCNGSYIIAGEVCFWKNYARNNNRDKIVVSILNHLKSTDNWIRFTHTLKKLACEPSYENFSNFRIACNQNNGFAVPITFLAFYNPVEFPMVDKHIANWWNANKATYGYEKSPDFSQREDGWIKPVEQNWNTYLVWKEFCNDYAKKIIQICKFWNVRARDIEMAVWMAYRNTIALEILL